MKTHCNSCNKDFDGDYKNCPECHGILTVKKESWTRITKHQFKAYEEVRRSGMFNMVTQAETVREYTGLSKEDYITIQQNYSKLRALYINII